MISSIKKISVLQFLKINFIFIYITHMSIIIWVINMTEYTDIVGKIDNNDQSLEHIILYFSLRILFQIFHWIVIIIMIFFAHLWLWFVGGRMKASAKAGFTRGSVQPSFVLREKPAWNRKRPLALNTINPGRVASLAPNNEADVMVAPAGVPIAVPRPK